MDIHSQEVVVRETAPQVPLPTKAHSYENINISGEGNKTHLGDYYFIQYSELHDEGVYNLR